MAESENRVFTVPDVGQGMKEMVAQLEKKAITWALGAAAGNKSQAAKLLGLNRTTLVEKMRRMGFELQKSNASSNNGIA